MKRKWLIVVTAIGLLPGAVVAQSKKAEPGQKQISDNLFGIFFEDLSYAADGGLYAELIQNGSFEYTPSDNTNYSPLTAWQYIADGFGYGTISVESNSPVNSNNPHYVMLDIQDVGQKGIGLKNAGFDGIVVKQGENYKFSVFLRQFSADPIEINVLLVDKRGAVLSQADFKTDSKNWKKYLANLTATATSDTASLVLRAKTKGKLAIDMVSLFPGKTFKNRPNGLRADLAQTIAELKPKFVRFPGGCLVHGDGIANIYRWKNTIGPVEQRVQQKNIWNYHQSAGLGYFEYFQFCEDIGAKPVPVVAAGVSCQNSGGTWRIGGVGQKGIPMDEMSGYVQDILDLIEYANGPVTSKWGAKRAQAGHPAPFHLQYLGVGNEDNITPVFEERFKIIYDAIKSKHPEITIIGTVGPAPAGKDYDAGWKIADKLAVSVVDEHYYEKPEWFLANTKRYDHYNRLRSKVYIGEYASHGNTLFNALAEAVYMTSVERNGDVVEMASYAPLIARLGHTSWNPNLIYFNGVKVFPTVNYYVQKLFCNNQGDVYYNNVVSFKNDADSLFAASCVKDNKTGDVIVKIVNAGPVSAVAGIDLSRFPSLDHQATLDVLTGKPGDKNIVSEPEKVVPDTKVIRVKKISEYNVPPYSLSVLRISNKASKTAIAMINKKR